MKPGPSHLRTRPDPGQNLGPHKGTPAGTEALVLLLYIGSTKKVCSVRSARPDAILHYHATVFTVIDILHHPEWPWPAEWRQGSCELRRPRSTHPALNPLVCNCRCNCLVPRPPRRFAHKDPLAAGWPAGLGISPVSQSRMNTP